MDTEAAALPTTFREAAVPAFDNGYAPIPVINKVPVLRHWNMLNQEAVWDRNDLIQTARKDFASDDCGCGLVVDDTHVVIDTDILDPEPAGDIAAIADRTFELTPLVRVGRAPKHVCIYRCSAESGIRSRRLHPIEILCGTGQCVAFAVHAETKQPYTWPTGNSPLTLPATSPDIPVITERQLARFLAEAIRITGRTHYGLTGRPPACSRSAGQAVMDLHQQLRLDAMRVGFRRAATSLLAAAAPGCRHLTMWAVVSAASGRGWSEDAVIQLLEQHFRSWAAPGAAAGDGVSEDDLERAIRRCFGPSTS
jgi:hypothetical protein